MKGIVLGGMAPEVYVGKVHFWAGVVVTKGRDLSQAVRILEITKILKTSNSFQICSVFSKQRLSRRSGLRSNSGTKFSFPALKLYLGNGLNNSKQYEHFWKFCCKCYFLRRWVVRASSSPSRSPSNGCLQNFNEVSSAGSGYDLKIYRVFHVLCGFNPFTIHQLIGNT